MMVIITPVTFAVITPDPWLLLAGLPSIEPRPLPRLAAGAARVALRPVRRGAGWASPEGPTSHGNSPPPTNSQKATGLDVVRARVAAQTPRPPQ
eukprot:6977797-Alexandrium_andersonii.AAC.1